MTLTNPRMSISVLVPDFRDGRLWTLCTTRKDNPEQWCFPGGKCENGEAPNVAAARELFEETGVSVIPNMITPVFTALDEHGWLCTTFLATTCEIPVRTPDGMGRRALKRDEDRFKPEEGTQVAWIEARLLLNSKFSPFAGYYRQMFDALRLEPALVVPDEDLTDVDDPASP